MKFLFSLILLASMSYGVWHFAESHPELKDKALQLVPTSSFNALDPRFTAAQIMERERGSLLRGRAEQYGNFSIEYHPFLLMEVKFTEENFETREEMILWDLIDGEMVLSIDSWEKSHGFADCINTHADRQEFEIISIIAKNGNQATRQTLLEKLTIENSKIDTYIARCVRKKLIVKQGNTYRVHLQDPKIAMMPKTTINIPFVTKMVKHSGKLQRRFSITQITRASEAAFGDNFAIRNTFEVYLPVYALTVQNSDGTLQTTHWNALNGKRFIRSTLHD